MLYLVVGIFLAVGATYVYATWDQARTGGSGQLSETNWNELANMVQSEFSSLNTKVDGISGGGAGTYMMGNSSQVYAWWAKYICENNFTGYHLCNAEEFIGRRFDPTYFVYNSNITLGGWVRTGKNTVANVEGADCNDYKLEVYAAPGHYGTIAKWTNNGFIYQTVDCYTSAYPPLCCSN